MTDEAGLAGQEFLSIFPAIPELAYVGVGLRGSATSATRQRLTEKTLFTRYAHTIGTPANISPKQAELSDLGEEKFTQINIGENCKYPDLGEIAVF